MNDISNETYLKNQEFHRLNEVNNANGINMLSVDLRLKKLELILNEVLEEIDYIKTHLVI